ncbi:MAG TPA: hypothetical protein VFZ69_08615 [Longimicrobiales bacterium]
MNAALIVLIALAVLLGGLFFGVTAIFVVPIAAVLAIVALVIWMLRRRSQHRPPIE